MGWSIAILQIVAKLEGFNQLGSLLVVTAFECGC
jgi:hypothetical protein